MYAYSINIADIMITNAANCQKAPEMQLIVLAAFLVLCFKTARSSISTNDAYC